MLNTKHVDTGQRNGPKTIPRANFPRTPRIAHTIRIARLHTTQLSGDTNGDATITYLETEVQGYVLVCAIYSK